MDELIVDYADGSLTPWQNRNGLWYKREDLHRHRNGVNGSKYRACRHLITQAVVQDGVDHVVSASSVRSPQAAITATICEELDLGCTIVVGASKPETCIKHESIRIAVEAGAMVDTSCRLAYNSVIQPYGLKLARQLGAYQVPYAISPPADASEIALKAFLSVGGMQVTNLPPEIKTLVIPFGSGNTTAGILYGLYQGYKRSMDILWDLQEVILVGVGPDRTKWLEDRLRQVGVNPRTELPEIEHFTLHGWFADYADSMPETLDDIVMHPTYEGKVVRHLNMTRPDWWTRRDGTTGFWIVGGPMS